MKLENCKLDRHCGNCSNMEPDQTPHVLGLGFCEKCFGVTGTVRVDANFSCMNYTGKKLITHADMATLPYIIAVDADGTLWTDKYPEIGDINYALVHELIKRREQGTKLVLWTCRADDHEGNTLTEAVWTCKAIGLEFDAINENIKEVQAMFGCDTRKVYANEYWDDKAVFMKYSGHGDGGMIPIAVRNNYNR